MKTIYFLLIILLLSNSCYNKNRISSNFIDKKGQELINTFKNYSIYYRGKNILVVDYYIDRKKYKLEENLKLQDDSVFLRFNDLIRFIFNLKPTKDSVRISFIEGHFDDSFYSYNYINNDTLQNTKESVINNLSKIVNQFYRLNLVCVEGENYNFHNWIRFTFYSYNKKNSEILLYVKELENITPNYFWNTFLNSKYVHKFNNNWYLYELNDFVNFSEDKNH